MADMVQQESSNGAEGFAEKAPDWNVCPKCFSHYRGRDCWYCGGDDSDDAAPRRLVAPTQKLCNWIGVEKRVLVENNGLKCGTCKYFENWKYCSLHKMDTRLELTCDRFERKVLGRREKTVEQGTLEENELAFWRAMREHQLLCERAQILSLAAEKLMKRAEALEPTINSGRKLFDIELGDTE
jgi:hypothetical protein